MNIRSLFFSLSLCVLGLTSFVPQAAAQVCPPDAPANTKGICVPTGIGLSDDDVSVTLGGVVEFLAGLVAVLAILAIVVSGLMYIMSGGDSTRTEAAKRMLTYAIIGLVVALLAWVIVVATSNALGAGGASGPPHEGDPCVYDPNC